MAVRALLRLGFNRMHREPAEVTEYVYHLVCANVMVVNDCEIARDSDGLPRLPRPERIVDSYPANLALRQRIEFR